MLSGSWGGDVAGASRSVLPHLLDGSVQLLNAEFCCGAVVHAVGVASDLDKSVFLPFLSRELQLAHLGIMLETRTLPLCRIASLGQHESGLPLMEPRMPHVFL